MIGLTLRLEFNYLPDALILDGDVRKNYVNFSVADRLSDATALVRIPEIGLGPKVELLIDGVDVRDNQRDFGLTREALLPSLNYEVTRHLRLAAVGRGQRRHTLQRRWVDRSHCHNPSLANPLRVPEGRTIAIAQRLTATWDLRNDPFAATKGTLLTATAEHVTALPLEDESERSRNSEVSFCAFVVGSPAVLVLDRGLALALSLEAGYNLQLRTDSQTYPDRLFFSEASIPYEASARPFRPTLRAKCRLPKSPSTWVCAERTCSSIHALSCGSRSPTPLISVCSPTPVISGARRIPSPRSATCSSYGTPQEPACESAPSSVRGPGLRHQFEPPLLGGFLCPALFHRPF